MADIALKNLKTVNNILNNDMEDDRTQFNQLSEELLKRAAFARSDQYFKKSILHRKRFCLYFQLQLRNEFASNFNWRTRWNHGNVDSLV